MKKLLFAVSVLFILIFAIPCGAADAYTPSGWKIEASSQLTSKPIENAFDGDFQSIWHSFYKAEDGSITEKDTPPFTVDITFPEKLKVGGIRYVPRQLSLDESTAGIWKKAVFYGSEDGKSFKEIGSYIYPEDLGYTRETVDCAVTEGEYKAVRIVITDAASNFASAAEINILGYGLKGSEPDNSDEEKTVLSDKQSWKIEASSSRAGAKGLIDNNPDTYWHSFYTDENGIVTSTDKPPYRIDVTFPEDVVISGFTILPRQNDVSGRFDKAELWVSDSEDGEFVKLRDLELSNASSLASFEFHHNVKIRKARLVILSTFNNAVGAASEIDFLPENTSLETIDYAAFAEYEENNKLYSVDKSDFSITENCKHWSSYSPDNLLDTSSATYWQTDTGVEGPWILTVDMKKNHTLSGFSYTPRQTEDFHGIWMSFEVEVGTDGENFEFVFSDTTKEKNLQAKTYTFPEKITARYIRFIISEGYTNRASASDISFLQTKADYESDLNTNTEQYRLKIGENTIYVSKNGEEYEKKIDTSPYIDSASSSTLIPLRGLLEEMGATLDWDGYTQTVTVSRDNGKIVMQIRNNLVYSDHPTYGTVRYTLRVAPEIKDSRTFIPLRFVSEQLGYSVAWDGETGTVTITK